MYHFVLAVFLRWWIYWEGRLGIKRYLICCCLLSACGGSGNGNSSSINPSSEQMSQASTMHLQYFGYALVDCGFSDRYAPSNKANYLSEVSSFTNLAQLCVFNSTDNVHQRLLNMASVQVKAILSIQAIFFEGVPDNTTGSKTRFVLRTDYVKRWQDFLSLNQLHSIQSTIGAFYIADEPFWNGISSVDLALVADLVKRDFPSVPTMLIEAPPMLNLMVIPKSIDWIGFDQYAVVNPDTDPNYLGLLNLLKSKRSRVDQKIVLVLEGQWLPSYTQAGYTEAIMKDIALRYAKLAKDQQDVIGLLGYLWPGGFDQLEQKGVRNLPKSVIDTHIQIGREITLK